MKGLVIWNLQDQSLSLIYRNPAKSPKYAIESAYAGWKPSLDYYLESSRLKILTYKCSFAKSSSFKLGASLLLAMGEDSTWSVAPWDAFLWWCCVSGASIEAFFSGPGQIFCLAMAWELLGYLWSRFCRHREICHKILNSISNLHSPNSWTAPAAEWMRGLVLQGWCKKVHLLICPLPLTPVPFLCIYKDRYSCSCPGACHVSTASLNVEKKVTVAIFIRTIYKRSAFPARPVASSDYLKPMQTPSYSGCNCLKAGLFSAFSTLSCSIKFLSQTLH